MYMHIQTNQTDRQTGRQVDGSTLGTIWILLLTKYNCLMNQFMSRDLNYVIVDFKTNNLNHVNVKYAYIHMYIVCNTIMEQHKKDVKQCFFFSAIFKFLTLMLTSWTPSSLTDSITNTIKINKCPFW